ncbi:MAG: hypothetical protein AAF799_20715 [Myxococcota bacterium]
MSRRPIFNPPYLPEIRYRIGDFSSFFDRLLEDLPQQQVPGERMPPLANLYLQSEEDWIRALCQVWAEVGEILVFYQERIANEGYLGTATQAESVQRILQSVGYDVPTHVAAETALTYFVGLDGAGVERVARRAGTPTGRANRGRRAGTGGGAGRRTNPSGGGGATPNGGGASPAGGGGTGAGRLPLSGGGTTTVPSGAETQSIAEAAGLPQIFSLLKSVLAAGSLNQLQPNVPSAPVAPVLTADTTVLRLAGTRTGLQAGDPILIAGTDPERGTPVSWIRFVESVTPNSNPSYTTVTWQPPLGQPSEDVAPPLPSVVNGPQVFGFAKSASLFGNTAAKWSTLRDTVKVTLAPPMGGVLVSADGGSTWAGQTSGLPMETPTAVLTSGDTTFVALTNKGLYRSDGGSFVAANGGISQRSIFTVAGRSDDFMVGAASGKAYGSVDGGESWDPIMGGPPVLSGRGRKRQVTQTQLPSTNVRALLSVKDEIHAGTDRGAFVYDGTNWAPDGTLTTPVFALVNGKHGVTAATSTGVVSLQSRGKWKPVGKGLPKAAVVGLAEGNDLVAATATGVWFLSGKTWTENNGTAPNALPSGVTITAVAATGGTAWVGTKAQGLYRSTDGGSSWQRVDVQQLFTAPSSDAPTSTTIPESLAVEFSRQGYPLTRKATLAKSGSSWTITDGTLAYTLVPDSSGVAVSLTDALPSVSALSVDGQTVVAVGAFNGFAAEQWPGFELSRTVDLSKVNNEIVANGWVVLAQNTSAGALSAAYQVDEVLGVSRSAFGVSGEITRLKVTPTTGLPEFDLRNADAWVQSTRLSLYSPVTSTLTPISGTTIELDQQLDTALPLPRAAVVEGKAVNAAIVPVGGVLAWQGSSWQRRALAQADVRALAVDAQGNTYVGTKGSGAFVLPQSATTTTPLASGLSAKTVEAMSTVRIDAHTEVVLAGSSDGVSMRTGVSGAWTPAGLDGRSVSVLATGSHAKVYAGTSTGGVYSATIGSSSAAPSWSTSPSLGEAVTAIAISGGGTAYAGTAKGVFVLDGGTWRALTQGLSDTRVCDLVFDASGTLLAATQGGVFSYSVSRREWDAQRNGLPVVPVQTLLVVGHELYAGTRGAGVYRRASSGRRWSAVPTGASNDVRVLIEGPDGKPWYGARNVAVLIGEDQRRVELAQPFLFSTTSVDTTGFGMLDQGMIPDTVTDAFTQEKIQLDAAATVLPLELGATWLVTSQSTLYVLALWQAVATGAPLQVYRNATVASVTDAPTGKGAVQTYRLQDKLGASGSLSATASEVQLQPAASGDATLKEHIQVTGQSPDPGRDSTDVPSDTTLTTLTLKKPLRHYYDASTVSIHANVGAARHGTAAKQVIGSGDSSQANQTFDVPGPVAATGSEPTSTTAADDAHPLVGMPKTTLSIDVSGQQWKQVQSFAHSGPDDRHYVVHHQADGSARVTFGDGDHGARLPTGRENVTARYTRGGGPQGEVGAGRVQQLRTQPQLVQRGHNPTAATIPATSGRRDQVAASIQALGRVVSIQDIRDYGLAYPGVGKARVDVVRTPNGRTLVLTVVGKGKDLEEDLAAAIASVRGPGLPLRVLKARHRHFRVAATLYTDPGVNLEHSARAAIEHAYDARARQIGQDVTSSEIVATLQAIDGVRGVELTALYRLEDSPSVEPVIEAEGARWSAASQRVRGGVVLQVESSPHAIELKVVSEPAQPFDGDPP